MISLVIPTYLEERTIASLIQQLRARDKAELVKEILIIDGGSPDGTLQRVLAEGASGHLSPGRGRAVQLNYGATLARQPILYFLHADTLPPDDYSGLIVRAVEEGFACGCFRLGFDQPHWFLRVNAWWTRWNIDWFRFGDQSLFVTRELFSRSGGYCEQMLLLEDQEIVIRLKSVGSFRVLPEPVTTSARKFLRHGIYRTQAIFFGLYLLYRLGLSQGRLMSLYRRLMPGEERLN
ncbi:TIGR04283 family arsenosugar biosynthesis glycosyltransferase [bacterium]|nr:TIGR04283 family arsenosugar biosynthesis glycosyltransferase [bacterium]